MKKLPWILGAFLTASALCAAPVVFDFEKDETFTANQSSAEISAVRWKTNQKSLLWQWQRSGAEVKLSFPETVLANQGRKTPAFSAWVYLAKPLPGRMMLTFADGKKSVANVWYNLNFQGWRMITADYRAIKVDPKAKIDSVTLKIASAPRSRFNPKSYYILSPEGEQTRSTSIGLHGKGVTSACHCGPPLNLNPQHKPPTGRRKPAQGTSSMCP